MKLRDKLGISLAQVRRGAEAGFTLVEMAIVLVIIGLIVGGILKGQEIVNNGRVKTQVAEVDAIKAAVQTFVDKYGYYPGDDPNANTQLGIDTTFVGNGDGFVSTAAATPDVDSGVIAVSTEPNMVWYELQVANLISGVISSAPAAAQTAALSYNYEGRIAGSFMAYADFSVATATPTINKMIRISGVSNPTAPTPVMREADASQIDLKYDDGLPYSGQIVAASYSTTNCCHGAACTAAGSAYGLVAAANTAGAYCSLLWVAQ